MGLWFRHRASDGLQVALEIYFTLRLSQAPEKNKMSLTSKMAKSDTLNFAYIFVLNVRIVLIYPYLSSA